MKVSNFESSNGNKVANQFLITTSDGAHPEIITFQSYDSVIAIKYINIYGQEHVKLDQKYWDYSKTTGKYRNQFLGETKAETQKKIDAGIYILENLN